MRVSLGLADNWCAMEDKRVLYFDLFSGAAGDMLFAALIDAVMD